MFIVSLEPLVDLVQTLHVSAAHGQALHLLLGFVFVEGTKHAFVALYLRHELVDLPILVQDLLHGLKISDFLLVRLINLLWLLPSNCINLEALAF